MLNDLAIILTERILRDLNIELNEVSVVPSDTPKSRSYYQVRQSILSTLESVIYVAQAKTKIEPREAEAYSGRESFGKYLEAQRAKELLKLILEGNLILSTKYESDYYLSRTDYIAVLDLNKVKEIYSGREMGSTL
jgi:hypothetical protein